jgi:hypothetical protein
MTAVLWALGVFVAVILFGIGGAFIQSGRDAEREERMAALRDEAAKACPPAYGRPQHIPEEVKARLRAEWDRVGELEPVEEAAR